jgi:hypothetical protein
MQGETDVVETDLKGFRFLGYIDFINMFESKYKQYKKFLPCHYCQVTSSKNLYPFTSGSLLWMFLQGNWHSSLSLSYLVY